MTGEAWRGTFQIGKETTPGTGVAATRRAYFDIDGSNLKKESVPTRKKFATTTRNNVRSSKQGLTTVSGTLVQPLSATEVIEILLLGLKGGVTPTGGGTPKLWTFIDGTTFDAATIEWHDGARVWEAYGCYVESFTISGSANGDATISAEIFGLSMVIGTLTNALSERKPGYIEGWETKLYADNIGATPGTTAVNGTLINWEITVKNNNARLYFAGNTRDANTIRPGDIDISASLTFDAAATPTGTELTNWTAATERLLRLEFGNNVVIDGADKEFVTVDIPGVWTAVELGEINEGSRAYKLNYEYVYDSVNGFGIQIRCQNTRSAAW